jgi:hypothetical protein
MSYRYILTVGFLAIFLQLYSQTYRREILRDNRIKKIFTYSVDSIGDISYLSRITFINDSGLIAKEIGLNRNKDTVDISTSSYDKFNKLISSEYINKEFKITDSDLYTYKKHTASETEIIAKSSKGTTTVRKIKTNGNKTKEKYYKNGKLDWKTTITSENNFKLFTTKCADGRIIKTKDFLNENKNIVKSEQTSFQKTKVVVGGYTERDPSSSITKDHQKYKTINYSREYITTFEYNEINLLAKKINFPTGDLHILNFTAHGTNYSCNSYEYLTE